MEVGGAGAVPLEGAPCPCKRRPAPCIDPRDREAAYFLNGDPSQIENRNVISWPTLSDFTSNTNRSLSGTRTNAATSSGISLLANGTFYVFERSATATGTVDLRSWSSIDSYASGAAGTLVGTTTASLGPSSGFHVSQAGAVYFLEGDPSVTSTSSRTLYSWSSLSTFLSDTNRTNIGTTTLGAGLGLSVGDSKIYFLEGSPVTVGNKKILEWPTVADFLAGTNQTDYNNANSGATTTSSGLAITPTPVPEPTTTVMLVAALVAVITCRRRTLVS